MVGAESLYHASIWYMGFINWTHSQIFVCYWIKYMEYYLSLLLIIDGFVTTVNNWWLCSVWKINATSNNNETSVCVCALDHAHALNTSIINNFMRFFQLFGIESTKSLHTKKKESTKSRNLRIRAYTSSIKLIPDKV